VQTKKANLKQTKNATVVLQKNVKKGSKDKTGKAEKENQIEKETCRKSQLGS